MAQGVLRLTARMQQRMELVAEWESSGQTMNEFCLRRGINVSTFGWWRRERRRLGAGSGHDSSVHLVEIARNGAGADKGFEIELHAGMRVHVPMRFDATALKQLLSVLAAC